MIRHRIICSAWFVATACSFDPIAAFEPGKKPVDPGDPVDPVAEVFEWADENEAAPADARLKSCLGDRGLDFFVAEADGVLALSFNNHTDRAAEGGYYLHVNGSGPPSLVGRVPCTAQSCEVLLSSLENGEPVHLSLDALDAEYAPFASSCELDATPHPLEFGASVLVSSAPSRSGTTPAIASGPFGVPLIMAWEQGGAISFSSSTDVGRTWSAPSSIPGAEVGAKSPRVAMFGRAGTREFRVLVPFVSAGSVHVARGTFDGALSFDAPVTIGEGEAPAIAARGGVVVVAFERDAQIFVSSSPDAGSSFLPPVRVDRGSVAHAPAVAIHGATQIAYVAFHGRQNEANDVAWVVTSEDAGGTWSEVQVRIDGGVGAREQRALSLAIDERTGMLSAAWEDHRYGISIYTARSEDRGQTFSASINSDVGLSGDQHSPNVVIDSARNLYAAFIDTTNESVAMFSRANQYRQFDPNLRLTEGGRNVDAPVVLVDAAGAVYAAWAETNSEGDEVSVFFARAE